MNLKDLLTIGIWMAPVCLQLLIVIIMIRRGLVRQFRYFFAYCLCVPARDVTLLFLSRGHNPYAYIYWVGDGLLALLQVVVLCEAFWCLVPVHSGFRVVATRIVHAVVALAAGSAFVLFAIAVSSSGKLSIETFFPLESFARAVHVMMLVVAMMFISHAGLTRRHYATGILLGSGIAALQLVPAELSGSLHLISNNAFVWLKPAIYDCAVIVWVIYLILPQSHIASLKELQQADLSEWTKELSQADLNEWDETLKGYLYR